MYVQWAIASISLCSRRITSSKSVSQIDWFSNVNEIFMGLNGHRAPEEE